ncbi:MAG: hypothetical protein HQK83_18155 [Fibrobacteria bacterium]|nr:hypothetical protein [Fibrobacteria bacterium]
MTFQKIIDKCRALSVFEERTAQDNFAEFVFLVKDQDEWNTLFQEIFGSAVKPAGTRPSPEDLEAAKDFGGIYPDQTLFKQEYEEFSVLAMIWPWQDCAHSTVKLGIIKKPL